MPVLSSNTAALLARMRSIICAWLAPSSSLRSTTRLPSRTASARAVVVGEIFNPGAPAGDLTNLAGGQRLTGVDTQGGHPKQSGERVDGRGAFGRHVRTGGNQNPQCSPDTVVASRPAQLLRLKGQDRGCDPAGVDGIRLAGTAMSPRVHPSRLHDLEAGSLHR